MHLKSFGCSFIYGTDLRDCLHAPDVLDPPASHLAWPALLAHRNHLPYQCWARPGSSNLQILETLLSEIKSSDPAVYVVNWTWIDRFGYISESTKWGTHHWNRRGWQTIMPSSDSDVSKIYYQHLHSQFRDKLETLICIKTAMDVLSDHDIRYIMTYTDELIFETEWHTSSAIACLQQCVSAKITRFAGQSYWNWITANGFEISDSWHPLEQAHAAAAELMMPAIDSILRKV